MRSIVQEEPPSATIQRDKPALSGRGEVDRCLARKGKSVLLRKTVAASVILLCFFFLGKALYHNLEEMGSYQWNLKPHYLVVSFLLLITNLAISAFAWKKVLVLFGIRLPFDRSFKITFVSGLGRYLPGKVWPYLSQIYLSGKLDIPKSVTLFSVFLLFGISSLVGALVFIYSLFLWNRFSPAVVSVSLFIFSAFLVTILSHRVLNSILRALTFICNKFKRGLVSDELTIHGGTTQIGEVVLIFIVNWMIFGTAAHFLVNSFCHFDLSQTVILCGIFAVSVVSGIIIFFIPAGLGVREGVLSYMLSLFVPLSTAVLISLAMRLWTTLGELTCFFIALKIKKPKLL